MGAEDDKARFANVILPLLHEAYALARTLTGNRADAEDVVQEACLRAFRAINTIAGNPRAWLLAIVRNSAYTWLAKNRPQMLVIVDDLDAVAAAQISAAPHDAATPESALIRKADDAQVDAAITALPMPFRETVMLRDVHGLSYQEISRVTGVPIGTVMSRLARGRARLATALGQPVA